MKANQKFVNGEDEAVSPVIAVILMVAITVVLAATVYVWVSGFGSQSSQAAKSISLTSAGALSGALKGYAVASATSGMKYTDISFTLNGAALTQTAAAGACTTPAASAGNWFVCAGGANPKATTNTLIAAGDVIYFSTASGDTLRALDTGANSVMLTLTVG